MKVRVDCSKCRKKMTEEANKAIQEAFEDSAYEIFKDSVDSTVAYVIAGAITVLQRHKEDDEYIKEFFKEMSMIFSVSEVFGQKIKQEDIMKDITEKYGLDWNSIEVNYPSKEDFLKSYDLKEVKKNAQKRY